MCKSELSETIQLSTTEWVPYSAMASFIPVDINLDMLTQAVNTQSQYSF